MVEMEVRKITKGRESNMVAFDFERTPITQIADYIIITASRNQASDIHFDPRDDGMMVRLRIDGDLQDYTYIPKIYERNLTTRLKLLANMNITESRLPQDGAIKGEFGGKYLDMRVSCLPLNTGEKIVIRILDYSRSLEGIEKLGFNQTNLSKIKRMMAVPNGIILVTGATGSGKSTTTYSMLQELNKPEINIVTVEDPIEMNIEGLNQVQVNAEIGMTFANALRSILRQDPNIILIGEIRDSETAQIAVRASITGHLVLSTIHTNNSLSTIERLLDMDVERYLMSTALTGIISQRLAKRLCPYCRIERETTTYEKKVFKRFMNMNIEKIYDINPLGCERCRKGYRGRIAIHEVLELDDDIRYALSNSKLTKEQLSEMVYGEKTITMLQDALGKAISGLTTFEEVYRVIELESDPEDDTAYLTRAIEDDKEVPNTVKETAKQAIQVTQSQLPTTPTPQVQTNANIGNKQEMNTQARLQLQDQNGNRLMTVNSKPAPSSTIQNSEILRQKQSQFVPNKYQLPKPLNVAPDSPKTQKTKVEKSENAIPELKLTIKTSEEKSNVKPVEESPYIEKENVFSEKDKVKEIDITKLNKSTDLKKESNIDKDPLKPTVALNKKTSNIEPVIISSHDIENKKEMNAVSNTIETTSNKEETKAPIEKKNETSTTVKSEANTTSTNTTTVESIKKNNTILPTINTEPKKEGTNTKVKIPKPTPIPTVPTTVKSEANTTPINTTTVESRKKNNTILPTINTEPKKEETNAKVKSKANTTPINTTTVESMKKNNTILPTINTEPKKEETNTAVKTPKPIPIPTVPTTVKSEANTTPTNTTSITIPNDNGKKKEMINKSALEQSAINTIPKENINTTTITINKKNKEDNKQKSNIKQENLKNEISQIPSFFDLPAIKKNTANTETNNNKLEKIKEKFITEMKREITALEKDKKTSEKFFITEMKMTPKIEKKTEIPKEAKKEAPVPYITEMKKGISAPEKERKKKEKDNSVDKKTNSPTDTKELKKFNFTVEKPKNQTNTLKKRFPKPSEKEQKNDDLIKASKKSNNNEKTDWKIEEEKDNKEIVKTVPKVNIFENTQKEKEEENSKLLDLDNELQFLGED